MEHNYEDNIKCPYCNWEEEDSWEFTQDSGTYTCCGCEKEFNVERNIKVTYNTSRIDCEENGTEHDYQFESVFESGKNMKMENNRIENFLSKRGANPKQRIERDNGGQYLKNLLLEFASFIRDETLVEVQSGIKK